MDLPSSGDQIFGEPRYTTDALIHDINKIISLPRLREAQELACDLSSNSQLPGRLTHSRSIGGSETIEKASLITYSALFNGLSTLPITPLHNRKLSIEIITEAIGMLLKDQSSQAEINGSSIQGIADALNSISIQVLDSKSRNIHTQDIFSAVKVQLEDLARYVFNQSIAAEIRSGLIRRLTTNSQVFYQTLPEISRSPEITRVLEAYKNMISEMERDPSILEALSTRLREIYDAVVLGLQGKLMKESLNLKRL